MFTDIIFAVIGDYYLPFMYTSADSKKPISIGDLLKNQNLPSNMGYLVMSIPDEPGVPQEVSGLSVPILCEVRPEGYYPLMSEAFVKYGVNYYPSEKNTEVIMYLTKLHHYLHSGQSPLGNISAITVPYNTIYAQFYASYNSALQAQQTQEASTASSEQIEQEAVVTQDNENSNDMVSEEQISETPVEEPEEKEENKIEVEVETSVEETPIEETSVVKGFDSTSTEVKVNTTVESNGENFINFKDLKTNLSGNYIEIQVTPQEELDKMTEAIKTLPVVPDSFDTIVPFVPNVRKYDKPVGTIDMAQAKAENPDLSYIGLSGVSFEDFERIIIDYYNTQDIDLKGKPQLTNFSEEIETVLGGKATLRQLLQVFNPEYGDNLTLLYELTKYVVAEESPNGLYNNVYFLCYLLEKELTLQGKGVSTVQYKVASIFSGLACDVKKFEAEEEKITRKDEDDGSDDVKQAGFIVDEYKEQIRCANAVIKDMVTDLIAKNKDITCQMTGGANITTLHKACILGTYGLAFMIKDNPILTLHGFDILSIYITEYMVHFNYFGIPIDYTALGSCIYELDILEKLRHDGESIYSRMSEEEYQKEFKETLERNSYSSSLDYLKNNNPFISQYTRAAAEPVDLKGLDLSLLKYIIAVYNGKPIPIAIVLENNSPTASINERYFLCPRISALYKEMAYNNIFVKGLYNSPEDIHMVKYIKDNGLTRELGAIPFYKEQKDKFVVINSATPLLSLQEIQKHLVGKNIPGLDTRILRIPTWSRGDVLGITEGLKALFNVV